MSRMIKHKTLIVTAFLLSVAASAQATQNVSIGVYRPSAGTWFLDSSQDNKWDSGDETVVFGTPTSGGEAAERAVVLAPAVECTQPFAFLSVVIPPGNPVQGEVPFDTFSISNGLGGYTASYAPNFFNSPGLFTWPLPLPSQTSTFSEQDPLLSTFWAGSWQCVACTNPLKNFATGFGGSGDIPLFGVWNPALSAGLKAIGVFHNSGQFASWWLDANGNDKWDGSPPDILYNQTFGLSTDLPVTGDFNSNHPGDEIAVFRNGTWFIDFNGDGTWDSGDEQFSFGQAGDQPVVAPRSLNSNGWTAACPH